MSEKVLDALMELFAIIANIESIGEKGRDVVSLFLRQQLNLEAIDKYLNLFDQYYRKHSESTDSKGEKATPVSHSVKALVICSEINTELAQKQKLIILIRLLEFINTGKISDEEFDFVSTVASAFNIDDDEFDLIKDYVLTEDPYELNYSQILVVDTNPNPKNTKIKHHQAKGSLDGKLSFLRVPSADMYLVRYNGNDELYLNSQPLQHNSITPFVYGGTIRNPRIEPIYYNDIASRYLSDIAESKISFKATNITYRFPSDEIGLHDVNLKEESGRLVGIMGASGAGKTTLLNVLCGISEPTEGQVTINGLDLYKEKDKLEGVIGYIPQDDTLIEELTVYQNLFYNAKLCMGHLTNEEIDERVDNLLNNLGLGQIKHLKVGSPLNKKISGGQRKRLNIGLELIREPSVLFVDEPTSGLSSRDSENIMDLLKDLSLKGKLVQVVIHQPSSEIYKMFDRMLILDEGGYPVYYGNPTDAIIYFRQQANYIDSERSECPECGNVNPEQIFNIIEAKVVDEYGRFTDQRKVPPEKWFERYNEHTTIPEVKDVKETPPSSLKLPSIFNQLRVFITRDVLSKLSNVQYMVINFTEAPILAFVLAYLVRYYNVDEAEPVNEYIFNMNDNIVAFIFMAVVVALFLGLTVSAEEIFKDRKILKRESFLNLSRTSYLLSKVVILFVISAIQAFTFVLISNLILGIHGMFFPYWLVLFSTSCFANMLGLNISSAFNSAVTIYILIPILLIPQLLLSGAIVKFDKLNPNISSVDEVPIAGEMMTSKWAFESLLVHQFKYNDYEEPFYGYDKVMSEADYKSNYWIPKLKAKIDFCDNHYDSKKESMMKQVQEDLQLLRNELKKEFKETGDKLNFGQLSQLTMEKFNGEIANKTSNYLDQLKDYYSRLYNKVNNKKDQLVQSMLSKQGGREQFIELKNNYHNEEIETLLRNKRDENRIIEHKGKLIQKIDPIFNDPDYKGGIGIRAHLFAPSKYLFGQLYDTLVVNVIVIWLMTLFLYITLYFDVLKRFLNGLANLFSKN